MGKTTIQNPATAGGLPLPIGNPVTGDTIYFAKPNWLIGMGGFPTRSYRYDGNGTTVGAVDHFGTVTAFQGSGTGSANKATATEPPLLQLTTSAQNTLTLGVAEGGQLGTNTGIFDRFRARIKIGAYGANARYWIGLGGQIGLTVLGATQYVSNTPAVPTIAFRAANSTDVNWQAVCSTGSSQTTVNTGVAVSTAASHVFEIAYDGTNVYFYIDGVLVATISTNIPTAASTLGNSSLVGVALMDNNNTNSTVTILFATMRIIDQS